MTPRLAAAVAAVLIGAAAAALAMSLGAAASRPDAVPRLPPATATVVRTTLAETRTVTGTLSLGEAAPARASGDAGPRILTWMAPEGALVGRGQTLYAIDGQPVTVFYGDAPLFRTLRFDGDDFAGFAWLELQTAQDDVREAELNLELERARLAEAESRLAELAERLEDSARAAPETREFAELKGAVDFAQDRLESLRRLAEAGAAAPIEVQTAERNIAAEQASFESAVRTIREQIRSTTTDVASGRAAMLAAERRLEDAEEALEALQLADYGDSDVTLLRENLAALGHEGPAGEALRAWQAGIGAPANGVVAPGQIVVAPGPVRVAAHEAQIGDTIEAGGGFAGDSGGVLLLTYTGTEKLVTVRLGVADHAFARTGQEVTIVLPDLTEVAGVISDVGAVVSEQAETEVTIAIPDQAALGALEAASVDVIFVSEQRDSVLAVPVTALLARPEGGFAVEVVDGAASRIVPVTTGLFANGRVEIGGDGIAEGLEVGVPG